MQLLALGGQRNAALAQYETCRSLLAEELSVEPDQETTTLYESIRDGTLVAPPFITPTPTATGVSEEAQARPVFVARECELAQLVGFLDQALAGRGRVAFVIGEPGSGKSILAQEFVRQAMDSHPDLVAVNGRCNAYTGIGDPYLRGHGARGPTAERRGSLDHGPPPAKYHTGVPGPDARLS